MKKALPNLGCLYIIVLFFISPKAFAINTNALKHNSDNISNSESAISPLFLLSLNTFNINALNKNDHTIDFKILEPQTTRDLSISYRFVDTSFGTIKDSGGAVINSPQSITAGDYQIIINTNGSGSSALVIELTDLLTGYIQEKVIKVASRQTNFFLKGSEKVYLKAGDDFVDPGFIANDAVLGDISGQVVIDNGIFDKDTPGEYAITYKLDINGETLFLNRTLNVSNGDAPVEQIDLFVFSIDPNFVEIEVRLSPINANHDDVTVELIDSSGFSTDITSFYTATPFTGQATQRASYIHLPGLLPDLYNIIVTSDSGISEVVTVQINEPINSITFSNTKSQIKIGESFEYVITTDPPGLEGQLFYRIDGDNNIIRFNSFTKKITGLAPGKITLIAESGNGVLDSFELEVLDEISPDAVQSIVLSPDVVNIKTNRETILSATVSPQTAVDKSLTWKSSNINVARVDDTGKISGVGVGTATMTATSVSNPNITATATVNVTLLEPTSVTVTPTSSTLNVGEFVILTGTVNPTDTGFNSLNYSSSNSNIAKVNSAGRVDALAAGTATITVSNAYKPSINTTVQITINSSSSNISPTSVKITPISSSDKLLPYGSTLQLNATLLPDNATNKTIVWRSRDESTAKVNANGLVTPVRQSEVGILAISEEDNTIRDEIMIRVYAYPAVLEDSDGDYYSKPNETITISVSGQSQIGQGGNVIVETSVDRFNNIKDTKTFPYNGLESISGSFTYQLPANGFSTFRARIEPNSSIHNDNVEIKITGGDKTYTKTLSTTGTTSFP